MTKYLFVNDLFVEDYVGGAELTSESLIKASPYTVEKIKSASISEKTVEDFKDWVWIFGNFSQMKYNLIMLLLKKKINYHIVEYDFKFCKLRSPEKHVLIGDECNCENESQGKLVSVFYAKAQGLWFMSKKQKDIYESKFPFLEKTSQYVLSSIFDHDLIEKLIQVDKENDGRWVVLDSPSWIKGTQATIKFAEEKELPYKLVGGISYNDMLNTLARSKGLIFRPQGGDTCPRIVIEAHLLGCELILNDNVLHKEEEWFTATRAESAEYLKTRASYFWDVVGETE
tara:strand:+ start:2197 stop:3051 length:855 start_codon:yes stop_codon:yes gene_type:complete